MKPFRSLMKILVIAAMLDICIGASTLYALPEGEHVENGEATFDRPNNTTLNVTANNGTVINFNSFNIAQNEVVNFNPYNPALAAQTNVLSRVIGPNPSYIAGTLNANLNLYLVNPHGINFAPTAQVNANNFVASTLDISTNNFINGNYQFQQNLQFSQILNEGNITANNNVALIASSVNNSSTGVIVARAGTVSLASGDKVTVSFDMRGLMNVEVNEKTTGKVLDMQGNSVKDAVANAGRIEATQVVMSAKTANDIFENAVNQTGIVKATGFVNENGVIKVVSNKNIKLSGTLEAKKAEGAAEAPKVEVVTEDSVAVTAPLQTKGDANISADNNIDVDADISAEEGDLALFADYDGDGGGSFTQSAGTISASGAGNVSIDGSGEMKLNTVKTDDGAIKIGTKRAPAAISGEPHFIHARGDFIVINDNNGVITTSRGDVLRYNPSGKLTIEAQAGRISNTAATAPMSADRLTLKARYFDLTSTAANTEV